jgi:hypothetical protein
MKKTFLSVFSQFGELIERKGFNGKQPINQDMTSELFNSNTTFTVYSLRLTKEL